MINIYFFLRISTMEDTATEHYVRVAGGGSIETKAISEVSVSILIRLRG